MRRLIALLALTACMQAPAQPVATGVYRLISINSTAFSARATISFATPGQVSGNAPCNSYSGALTAALPRFATSGIMSTEIGCDALADEAVFFSALSSMTQADISATQVTLSNPTGGSMVFIQP